MLVKRKIRCKGGIGRYSIENHDGCFDSQLIADKPSDRHRKIFIEDDNARSLIVEHQSLADAMDAAVQVLTDRLSSAGELVELLDDIIEENPEDATLYLNRGLIRELSGNLNGACEDWNRAKELGAEQAEAYLKECNNL